MSHRTCDTCDGQGGKGRSEVTPDGGVAQSWTPCKDCNGTGRQTK